MKFSVTNIHEEKHLDICSSACCDTVNLEHSAVGNGRAVPIDFSHLASVYGHEDAGYVIADLLQYTPDSEAFIPRYAFSPGLYHCVAPRSTYTRSQYNREMKPCSQAIQSRCLKVVNDKQEGGT